MHFNVLRVVDALEGSRWSIYKPDSMHSILRICPSPPTYTHIHTHTYVALLFYHFSFPLYLSVLSFQFPRAGCRESFANWFLQRKRIRSPRSPQYPRAPFLLDDSPVSCSCQLSRAFSEACYSSAQFKSAELQGLQKHFPQTWNL